MEHYLLLLIGTVFVNNIVMSKILGLCPFMGVSRKLETSIGMGAATTFVLTLASGASYLINTYLLGQDLGYLRTLSFIVVIAAIVGFTEMFIKKTSPVLFRVLGIYLPLITTNCAVLGVPLLNAQEQHGFVDSLLYGLGGLLQIHRSKLLHDLCRFHASCFQILLSVYRLKHGGEIFALRARRFTEDVAIKMDHTTLPFCLRVDLG